MTQFSQQYLIQQILLLEAENKRLKKLVGEIPVKDNVVQFPSQKVVNLRK